MSDVLDGDRATNLQEILKMSTSIFMCLSAEWGSLHHVDEAWLEFELKVVGFVLVQCGCSQCLEQRIHTVSF